MSETITTDLDNFVLLLERLKDSLADDLATADPPAAARAEG
ncbi:hypothetical protein ACIGXM_08445 [Kitasatospora sp. NPDC052896]